MSVIVLLCMKWESACPAEESEAQSSRVTPEPGAEVKLPIAQLAWPCNQHSFGDSDLALPQKAGAQSLGEAEPPQEEWGHFFHLLRDLCLG